MLNVCRSPSHAFIFFLLLLQYLHFLFLFLLPPLNFAPPPPGSAVFFFLTAPCALMNPVKHLTARLCDCNEGQTEKQQGIKLFSCSVSPHTLLRKYSFPCFCHPAPSPIISVFCYPNRTLPGEAARERDWRGTKQILHLHVVPTLARC